MTPLTPREREVLDLIAGGSTNREIAAALHLSPHTIKEHTSSLYRKLEALATAPKRCSALSGSGCRTELRRLSSPRGCG